MYPLPIGYKIGPKTDRADGYLIPEARSRHMAVFGKSGVGKTTLLRNTILWDIWNGSGVTVIDPHGQLIDDILQHIPKSRTNDVIYFRPADAERVGSINILEKVPEQFAPLVVSSIVSTFKALWSNGWGPQTEYLLTNFCFALVSQGKPTSLLDLLRLITEPEFREQTFARVNDPVLKTFYRTYEDEWDEEQRAKASAPLLNKVSAFATNPLLRAVIGQHRSSFNFRRAMDQKQILLCDLGKGALGADIASLLGSLVTTKLYLAALSRQDQAESDRVPHYFYIDEVHNFTHGIDLSSILAEARKYRLSLTVATQTLAQLRRHNDDIVPAIFGNCGSLVSFRVSGDDAVILAREFASDVIATQLENLPDHELYLRTLVRAEGSTALMASHAERHTAYPPFQNNDDPQSCGRVCKASNERYTLPRQKVDAFLANRFATMSTSRPAPSRRRALKR
ncbi:MAG: AAA-like domain protein [Acidobacteria bacterium OLB17]|nr:MAG: AAA-like domain protein [Acidobacteria bacterium OLB17]MCZ2390322.1 type IV secretion system DNA-binding domain-containing protein [Acidobacteriota bacterium]